MQLHAQPHIGKAPGMQKAHLPLSRSPSSSRLPLLSSTGYCFLSASILVVYLAITSGLHPAGCVQVQVICKAGWHYVQQLVEQGNKGPCSSRTGSRLQGCNTALKGKVRGRQPCRCATHNKQNCAR